MKQVLKSKLAMDGRVAAGGSVYMAAVLEYLCAEILGASSFFTLKGHNSPSFLGGFRN